MRSRAASINAIVTPASAAFITYNLTGTWAGSIKCKSSLGGAKNAVTLTPTMHVTQAGLNIGIQLLTGPTSYAGIANPDTKKPEQKGEFALALCGTNNVLGDARDELGRMAVKAKPGKVKASLKGVSYFSNPGIAPAEAGVCKWKFTRTDTVDSSVDTACAVLMGHQPPTAR